MQRLKQSTPYKEKRWLVTTAVEESSKGTGFMLRLKLRWGEQYPEKNRVSKQNLRDNAAKFQKELEWNVNSEQAKIEIEQDIILTKTNKWKNEMKVNLLKIEKHGRNRGRGFTKRMKEAWDDIYEISTMITQTLRDNASRFLKGKSLFNLIKVIDGYDVKLEVIQIRAIEPFRIQENFEENENNEEEINENINEEEDEETRFARLKFEEILRTLAVSTKENIEEKGRESD